MKCGLSFGQHFDEALLEDCVLNPVLGIAKPSTRLIGDCVEQLMLHQLVSLHTSIDKEEKLFSYGHKKYVLSEFAKQSVKELVLAIRDLFPDKSAVDSRTNAISFLCLATMGDMQDKRLSICVNLLCYLAEDNLW
jgi:hypothetical protein